MKCQHYISVFLLYAMQTLEYQFIVISYANSKTLAQKYVAIFIIW